MNVFNIMSPGDSQLRRKKSMHEKNKKEKLLNCETLL